MVYCSREMKRMGVEATAEGWLVGAEPRKRIGPLLAALLTACLEDGEYQRLIHCRGMNALARLVRS